MLLEKIEIIEKRYDEIYQMISNPDIIADQKKYIQLNKELKELSKLVETGKMYKNAVSQKLEAEEYLNSSDDDDDMIAMAKEELDLSKQAIKNLEEEIKILLKLCFRVSLYFSFKVRLGCGSLCSDHTVRVITQKKLPYESSL